MASNFKPWVDSPTAGQQVQSASVFATDAQRVDGFKAGDPASALRVNSALRQANIVVAGLMQMCDDIKTLPSELSLMSTVTQVKNAIKAAIDELDATVLASAKSYTDTRETVINGKITNVQNQVTSNTNRLDALEPRVDDLEKGTPAMTVGKAEMLTEPFAVGFDTATAETGYVKFASVSLSSSYRSAVARFEVLDKNPINVQTNMCGVEVVVRNMSATDVAVTAQLLYGSSQYLSRIYACVKKGTYPVIVDLYFNITSNNLMETISCIKPLFTFARATGTATFAFISDNVLVTDLPTDTTNIRLSTAYTPVTEAKTAKMHTAELLALNADLNAYYGEEHWGRNYYVGGDNSIVNRPVENDANGFSLEILRGSSNGTVQRCTLYSRGGSPTQPVVFTRWYIGAEWKEWQETAEAVGTYPNLIAGKSNELTFVSVGTTATSNNNWYEIASVPVNASAYDAFSIILLLNGRKISDQMSGIVELEGRCEPNKWTYKKFKVLCGNLVSNHIAYYEDSNKTIHFYLWAPSTTYAISTISAQRGNLNITSPLTLYQPEELPTGLIYGANFNFAAYDSQSNNIPNTYAKIKDVSNPNLVINSDFSINQRGQKDYTGNGYTVDRWRGGQSQAKVSVVDGGGVTLSFSEAISNGGTALRQIIDMDASKLIGERMSISTKVTAVTGSHWYIRLRCSDSSNNYLGEMHATISASGIVSATGVIPANTKTISFEFCVNTGEVPTTDSLTVKWAKLEVGSVATAFTTPLIAEELPKCQRYFVGFKFTSYSSTSSIISGAIRNSAIGIYDDTAIITLWLPVNLREIRPSITFFGDIDLSAIDGSIIRSMTFDGGPVVCYGNCVNIPVKCIGVKANTLYSIAFSDGAYIAIDAEL